MHRILKKRNYQLERAEYFNRKDGGVIDKELEQLRRDQFKMAQELHGLMRMDKKIESGSRLGAILDILKEDDDVEVEKTQTVKKEGGNIIATEEVKVKKDSI